MEAPFEIPQAFELRQKQKRVETPRFLRFLRNKPCLLCHWSGPVDAAHIRFSDFRYGKRETGMGEKTDDRWAVPLCRQCHTAQHNEDERTFWNNHKIDITTKATEYWSEFNGESLPQKNTRRASA